MATEEELDALAAGDSRGWLVLDEAERRWSWYYGQGRRRALPWGRLSRVQLVEAVCDADGYVREPAVRQLRSSRDPEALPLLVVRCVDWVRQVREVARAAVLDRFSQADLAPLLPLVVVLSRRAVDDWVDEHLLQPMLRSPELLDLALATADLRTRRMVHETAVRAGLLSDERLVSIAVHDHDDVIRTRTGHLLLDRGDSPYVQLLLDGGAPKVRARALQLLGAETARERLAESSSLVRSMAQALVLHAGGDPAAYYRDALRSGAVTRATVAGLGETGTLDDVDLLRAHFVDERPRVRVAAVRGLRRLLANPSDPRAVRYGRELLADPSPGVVREAAALLDGRLGPADRPFLLGLAAPARPVHVRRGALTVLRGSSRWSRLATDLWLLSVPGEPLADEARRDLDDWRQDGSSAFTRPSPDLAARIAELLAELEPRLGPAVTAELRRLVQV
ncbi:HEAT repeat domain-containing protein [Amycolatopsis sp. NPDC049253]|uniref:HEAT repeat domain-containing protein n=1 Tax=Amycolatopsis sp. NPDC049253 TaxID=3155274 RepID=UPI0034381BCE